MIVAGHQQFYSGKSTCSGQGSRVVWPEAPATPAPLNGTIFGAYIEQMITPTLSPGDNVILENLASHKVKGVRQAIGRTVPNCSTCRLTHPTRTPSNTSPPNPGRCLERPQTLPSIPFYRYTVKAHRQAARPLHTPGMPKLRQKLGISTVNLNML